MPILTEVAGTVKFGDLVEGVTITEKLDEVTGLSRKVVIESRAADLRPRITIKDAQTGETRKIPGTNDLDARYLLPVGSNIVAQDGNLIDAGEVLAKIPRDTTKVQDITGGLPRVAELFEARKPKDHAIISEIDGEVSMGKDTKGKRKVVITPISPRVRRSPIWPASTWSPRASTSKCNPATAFALATRYKTARPIRTTFSASKARKSWRLGW